MNKTKRLHMEHPIHLIGDLYYYEDIHKDDENKIYVWDCDDIIVVENKEYEIVGLTDKGSCDEKLIVQDMSGNGILGKNTDYAPLWENIKTKIVDRFYLAHDDDEQIDILTNMGFTLADLESTDHYFNEDSIKAYKEENNE